VFRRQENDSAASHFLGGYLEAGKLKGYLGQWHLCFVSLTEKAQNEYPDILDNLWGAR
jgi:hypothetical protein